MKKTKVVAITIAIVLILVGIMPITKVVANSSYTLNFSVMEGTEHTIKVEDGHLYIDDGIVELRDNEDSKLGIVSETGENKAKITVTDGPNGKLNFGGNKFSLFYNGKPYALEDELNSNQDFLVQESENLQNGNTEAKIIISAGEGTWLETVYDENTGISHEEERDYDDMAEFYINGTRWNTGEDTITYNSEEEDTTVNFVFETLWIDRYYEDIVINGVSYNVSDYLDFDDRTAWLNANKGSQTVSFSIPNVRKADTYNIVVKHGKNNGKKFMATFLWTADPSQEYEIERNEDGDAILDENGKYKYILDNKGNKIPGRDYIGHAKLEFVKAVYEVGGKNYIVTEKQLEGKLQRDGNFKTCSSDDGFLTYGVMADVDFDDGGLTLPGNAEVTMRVVPDYGYQVTSVNGGKNFITTDAGVSEFTVVVPEGTAGYFTATVEKVENTVNPTSEKVKSGNIELGKSAKNDIKNGTVRLTVEDIELSSDKIKNFEEKVKEAGDYTVTNYLDINLDKVLFRGSENSVWSEQIHHMSDKALITLQLEEGVDVSNIVIVHNIDDGDEFEIIKIESYNKEKNTISFYTDSFSNYAIASKNISKEEVKETKKEEPTGKESEIENTTKQNTSEQEQKPETNQTSKNIAKLDTPKTGDKIALVVSTFIISVCGIIATVKFNEREKK